MIYQAVGLDKKTAFFTKAVFWWSVTLNIRTFEVGLYIGERDSRFQATAGVVGYDYILSSVVSIEYEYLVYQGIYDPLLIRWVVLVAVGE